MVTCSAYLGTTLPQNIQRRLRIAATSIIWPAHADLSMLLSENNIPEGLRHLGGNSKHPSLPVNGKPYRQLVWRVRRALLRFIAVDAGRNSLSAIVMKKQSLLA